MSKYTTSKGPYESIRYRKDGRLIAAKNVPDNILQVLRHNPEFNEEEIRENVDKACLFCGAPSKLTRLVNLQTVFLCDTHYYDKTTGRIAQEIRSKQDGQESPQSKEEPKS